MIGKSPLEKARKEVVLKQVRQLQDLQGLTPEGKERTQPKEDQAAMAKAFPGTLGQPLLTFQSGGSAPSKPLRVGVVFSGGQASGGHNVVTGLYDALISLHPQSELLGFLDGPAGVVANRHQRLTTELLADYRNQGGFDLLGSGRTKIETADQLKASLNTCRELRLDGLVIVGGDDSNTNAAVLAEYFLQQECPTVVVGVPKTIDGDLKNEYVETSFGFDTACKTFAEGIGNLCRDSLSAKKYYFFVKLMGRSASHVALECALQTHANMTLIGEEIAAESKTLHQVVREVASLVVERADRGKNYGVVLVPEGIIEFIPEFRELIGELNRLLAKGSSTNVALEKLKSDAERLAYVSKQLTSASRRCFDMLPDSIQLQLMLDRDPHGNVQVSKIETERMLIELVKNQLKALARSGQYKGKFNAQPLFFGYEGRSGLPSNFDAHYCYALGQVAALLVRGGCTGYMSCVRDLHLAVEEWKAAGVPITMLLHLEVRNGKSIPVIAKALVDLEGPVFSAFKAVREEWALEDDYECPGPMQFQGPLAETITNTLKLERGATRLAVS